MEGRKGYDVLSLPISRINDYVIIRVKKRHNTDHSKGAFYKSIAS